MIYINKQNEPPLLKQYKKEKQDKDEVPTYKDFSENKVNKEGFKQLRGSLLNEQKYICCYCQQRIPEPLPKTAKNYKTEKDKLHLDRMKTEHFHPKGGEFQDLDKVLDYSNLLAACLGNQKNKKENHCDSAKGHQLLQHISNPALGRKKDFKDVFSYNVKRGEVVVFSTDKDIDREINKVLNLNEQNLRFKRSNTIFPIIKRINDSNNNPKKIKDIIELYKQPKDNKLRPFSGFVISWLEKRFKDELKKM